MHDRGEWPVAHLFYDGDVKQHNFKNFEFKADVMTTAGSNSGIYFHTVYQEKVGQRKVMKYRRTIRIPTGEGAVASMVQDVKEVFIKDNEWFTEYIKVEGKR
jgi:hypothetical protein